MFQESGSFKIPAAAFTAFQRMPADNFSPDGDGADIIPVFDLNGAGGTDVSAGGPADTASFDGNNEILSISFHHFKGVCPDNLLADIDTQSAADASIGFHAGFKAVFICQL